MDELNSSIGRSDATSPSLGGLRAFEAAARHLSFKRAAAGTARHADRDQPPGAPTGSGDRRACSSGARARCSSRRKGKCCCRYCARASTPSPASSKASPARSRTPSSRSPRRRLSPPSGWCRASRRFQGTTGHRPHVARDAGSGRSRFGCRGSRPALRSRALSRSDRRAADGRPLRAGGQSASRHQATGDLQSATLLHSDWQRSDPRNPTWRHWLKLAGIDGIDPRAGMRFSDETHAIQAAVAGTGIALHSLLLVAEELDRNPRGAVRTGDRRLHPAPGARPRPAADRGDGGRAGLVADAIHRSAPIVL